LVDAAQKTEPAPSPISAACRCTIATGNLLMVVEAPAGSRLKLRLRWAARRLHHRPPADARPRLSVSTAVFVPSTIGRDGDPGPRHDPGGMRRPIPAWCWPAVALGVAKVRRARQGTASGGVPRRPRARRAARGRALVRRPATRASFPASVRDEIESFFPRAARCFEDKSLDFLGWDGPRAADRQIRASAIIA